MQCRDARGKQEGNVRRWRKKERALEPCSIAMTQSKLRVLDDGKERGAEAAIASSDLVALAPPTHACASACDSRRKREGSEQTPFC